MLSPLRDIPDRENLRGRLAQASSLNHADRACSPRTAALSRLISAISLLPQSPIFSRKGEKAEYLSDAEQYIQAYICTAIHITLVRV